MMPFKEKTDYATMRWMMHVAGKNKYHILLLALVQTVLGASVVGYALFLRGLIDHAVAGDSDGFWLFAGLLILLILFLTGLRWVKRFLDEFLRSSLENRFKKQLFHGILRKDYGQIRAIHSAEWMNRLTNDTKIAADGMSHVLPNFCEMSARLLAAVLALILMEPSFSLIIIPGGLILILFTFLFRSKLKGMHQEIQRRDGDLRVFYQERLASQIILRVFSRERKTEEEQTEYLHSHQQARLRRNRFSNLCNTGFSLVMNGAYILGAVYCGFGILNGTMTYGTFTAVLQLVSQIQSPFANLSGVIPQYYAMTASADRLREIEGYSEEPMRSSEAENCNPVFQTIGLRNVTFTYPALDEEQEETAVLQGFDLEVHRGEFLAMTGPSGCGKSTVLKVLMALYPIEEGERYIMAQGEHRELTGEYRPLFSYVPQGNMLIHGSIREIIAFGDENMMREESAIWEALHTACADGFVRDLENGIDTILGEQGAGLSEGQMQRLSIARAVFSSRPVLMLDEATSALDLETEQKLLRQLKSNRDLTVIMVTHRPAAFEVADRIIDFAN